MYLVSDSAPKALAPGFGARLRESRKRLGLTQDELGAKCSIGRSWVSQIEKGTGNLGLARLAALASGMPSLDMSYLLTGRKGLLFELSDNFTPEDLEMLSRLSAESADLLMAMVRQTLLRQGEKSARTKRNRTAAR